ncbi:MAG: hypothetical protein IJT58_00515 [Synergistaceae bacterium]|nr:hypothetical protein [Synergistaceae bacterium]
MAEDKRNLRDIIEVRRFLREYDVNERLQSGWVLLDQFTQMDTSPKDLYCVYIVGRPKSVAPDPPDELSEYIERQQHSLSEEEMHAIEAEFYKQTQRGS